MHPPPGYPRPQRRYLTRPELLHFGEAGEPGDGEAPADSKLAQTLAKQALKNKAIIALPFRQLWRHKYIEHNYDADQAWKLFYWAMTHDGAGGKGFNPATRKAAAKLMTAAFSRWAKADMKAKVQRADGAIEKPVGEISRAEFVKWFVSSAPATSEEVLGDEFVIEADAFGWLRVDPGLASVMTGGTYTEVKPHWVLTDKNGNVKVFRSATAAAKFMGTHGLSGLKGRRDQGYSRTGKPFNGVVLVSLTEPVDEARPDAPPSKIDKREPTERVRLVTAYEQGVTFKTGSPVTFRFMHNNESAPKMGARFQQDIEPSGYYMTTADDMAIKLWTDAGKDFSSGTASFRNPLVLDWGMAYDQSSWKYALWQKYGKTRKALARALIKDGYDGVVTVRNGVTSEIVALKGKPKMTESLRGMFVEQDGDEPKEPPVKKAPKEPKPEKTDLEKDEEKAEELGYELKDVQIYYDMQLASGLDQGAALAKTKKQFKLKRVKVNPIGKIMCPEVPDLEKKRQKERSKAPPPPPPEEVPAGGDEEPMAGGAFPEGPRGPAGPTGPQGPPTPGGEE